MSVSMPYSEHGVTVSFPDSNYFRLGDCAAYKSIQHYGVKEMDFGWFELNTNTLWLVELKAFYNPANPLHASTDLTVSSTAQKKIEELRLKSIHTISQVCTNRTGIASCLPYPVSDNMKINLIHLLHVMPDQEHYLGIFQDKLRIELKPYIGIFKIASVSVLSYTRAVGKLSWVL